MLAGLLVTVLACGTCVADEPPVLAPGLVVKTYDATSGTGFLNPISNLMAVTPSGESVQIDDIHYPNGSFVGPHLPGLTSPDTFALLWEGWFDVSKDGPGEYTFGSMSDDGSVIFIDLNGDGDFNGPGELIVNNNFLQPPTARTGTVNLAGSTVRIAIGFFEQQQGETMIARFKKGSGLVFDELDPINGTSAHFLYQPPPPEAPVIVSAPSSLTIFKGTSTSLEVLATGFPEPAYQWYSGISGDDSDPIAGATSASFTTPVLWAPQDYWVRASNSEGVADSPTATVTVISNNTDLAALEIVGASAVTPVAGARIYQATAAHATESVTISATAAEDTSEVVIASVPVGAGGTSAALPLVVGPNVFELVVTAEFGNTSAYTVIVNRENEGGGTDYVAEFGRIIDDAVFAHDFEVGDGDLIIALVGPDAVKSTGISVETEYNGVADGLAFSPTFLKFPDSNSYHRIASQTRTTAPESGFSFSIFYNDRGDNGSDGGFSLSSNVRLLSAYGGSGQSSGNVYQGPYFGIETHEGLRKLVFRTPTDMYRSTAAVPNMDGEWHQAGFTFDEGMLHFYFDGQPLGDPTDISATWRFVAGQQFDWTVGEDPQLGDTSRGGVGDEFFDNGSYDEAALWERALSPAEMYLLTTQGLAAAHGVPLAPVEETDFSHVVKRLDFGLMVPGRLTAADSDISFRAYTGALGEGFANLADGLLKVRNFDNGGVYEFNYELLNTPGNQRFDPGEALRIEAEIETIRNDHGTFVSVTDGQHGYGFQIQSGGVLLGGIHVAMPVDGRRVYRLESPANDPEYRFYVDDVLRYIGTAGPDSSTKLRFGDASGAFNKGSDSDWSFLEVRQSATEAWPEEVAVRWVGGVLQRGRQHWVHDGNWGMSGGAYEWIDIPKPTDQVVIEESLDPSTIFIGQSQRATSLIGSWAVEIAGLRLAMVNTNIWLPSSPSASSMEIGKLLLVESDSSLSSPSVSAFIRTPSLHISGVSTRFTGNIGRIDGRLSGSGTFFVPGTTDPNNQNAILGFPYPDLQGLVIFGKHSPGGGLAHLDADYVPGVGLQTIEGNLRYAPGSVFEWDAGVGVRGVAYDALNVDGDLTGDGAVFRVVLPGSQTFDDAFWSEERSWPDVFVADNAASLDLALVFSRFEYANADGLLRGEDGAFQHGKFRFVGTTLVWEPGGYSLPNAGMELVANGGAEHGDTSGWTGAGIESVPAEVVPGVGADTTHTLGGRIFKAGNQPGTSELSQVVVLPVFDSGGLVTRFAFDGMIQARDGEEGEIELVFRDADDGVVDSILLTDDDTAEADWRHVAVAGPLPELAVTAEIILRARAVESGLRRVAFDNFSLVVTTSEILRKVDLDATVHVDGEANAVEVFLEPGRYMVRPSPFARFDAWHGWHGSGGSAGVPNNLSRGWRWGFAYRLGESGIVRKVSSGRLEAHAGLAYPVALDVEVLVTQAGTVRFWIPEDSSEDNAGGVSLLIERAGTRADSLAHTVGPVFHESAVDSPFRSVGFIENAFYRGAAESGAGVVVTAGTGDDFFRFDFAEPHPTHAGVVWLGGEAPNGVVAEFFDASGMLVATLGPAMMDESRGAHFFGAVFRGGIAAFTIAAPGGYLVLGDLEYGIASEGADRFAEEPRFSGMPGFLNPAAVRALAVGADGTRWVGGDFSDAEDTVGGRMVTRGLAGFDAEGGLVANPPTVGDSVTALAVMGGRLWVVGSDGLAMVTPEGVIALDAGGEVVAMVAVDDTLYVATRERVAAWGLDVEGVPEELPNPWAANTGAEIRCLVATADGLVVGGDFSEFQGEVADGLVRIDWGTGVVESLAGGPVLAAADSTAGLFVMVEELDGRAVRLLAESEDWVDLEGDFVALSVRGASLWVADAAGGLTSFPVAGGESNGEFSVNGVADVLVVAGDDLHVLGRFNRVGGVEALCWAVVDDLGVVTPGGALGVPGVVECFARQPDGRLLVGGSFQWGSGRALGNFARLHPAYDRLDATWRPDFAGGVVMAIAVAGDEIFVGGDFAAADGVAGSLAKFGLYEDGGPKADWSPEVARVAAIATNRDHVFVAGDFDGTTALRRVVRRTGEVTVDWGSELGNGTEPVEIMTILLHEEHVYLGGRFASVGTAPAAATRTSVARLALADGVHDVDWNPNLFLTAEESPVVSTILIDRGAIYLAGEFTKVQLADQAHLARMSMDALFDGGWRPAISQPLQAMLRNGENLFVAGRDVFTVKTTAGSIQQVVETSDGEVRALDFDAGRIVAGGAFEFFNEHRDPAFAATPFLGSARVVFREGRIHVYPDDGMGPFVGSFLITSMEGGRLLDQPTGTYFSGGVISAALGARGLLWIPDVEGAEPRVTVTPLPPGGLNAPDLSPVTTLLAEDSSAPNFFFESTWMTVFEGDLVTAFVNFTGTEEELGAVRYEIVPGSAREYNGATGDYIGVVQPLVFEWNALRQMYQAPLRIPVLEDQQAEGPEDFFVRLVDPSSGLALGPGNLMRVSIIDGARLAGTGIPPAVLDPLRVFQPAPLPVAGSSLRVDFSLADGGGWRLFGDAVWRASGDVAENLQNGQFHHYDMRPADDAGAPQGARRFLGVNENGVVTGNYGTAGAPGSLRVNVLPFELTGGNDPEVDACWRVVGSETWHPAGEVVSVSPGLHLIEFSSPDAAWVNPGVRPVAVATGLVTGISAVYVPLRGEALVPEELAFSAVLGDGLHQYLGRIETPLGFATGTAVNEQTVLTAARVLWSADSLTVASRVAWLHQKHAGEYQPAPRSPRGVFLMTGYAQELAKDREAGTAVNSTGNLRSDNLDVGVAYFTGIPVARGGFSGFRADFSKAAGFNPWLLAEGERVFAGYPSGGAADGRMHSVAFTAALAHVQNQVYAAGAVQGRPGMEGSPMFQRHPDGRFHPTAIYLGENRGTRFRAFDSDVAELVFRSEFIAAILNFSGGTGGGDEFVNTISGDDFPIGFLLIDIPPGMGRWRAVDAFGVPVSVWYASGEFAPVIEGEWTIEFEPMDGFATPDSVMLMVGSFGVTSAMAEYEALPGGLDEVWLEEHFTEVERGDPAISGWNADPDGDGLVNLLEFAFGMHPREGGIVRHVPGGDGPGLPSIVPVAGGGLEVRFLRRAGVLDYRIQTLSPAGEWDVFEGVVEIEETDDPAWERVKAAVPGAGLARMFARVRVELNPEPIDKP